MDQRTKILKKRAKVLAKQIIEKKQKIEPIEIIPFIIEKENFGIEISYVKEIYPLKDYTFLPEAPPYIYGLTNVRRRTLPIISLQVLFDLQNDETIEKKLLIMENEIVEFALLIDYFSAARTLSKSELQSSLPTLTGIREEFLKGILIDGTAVLDGEKLFLWMIEKSSSLQSS